MSSTLPSWRQRGPSDDAPPRTARRDAAAGMPAGTISCEAPAAPPRLPLRRLPDSSLRLVHASTGDHPLVERFLSSMLHGSSQAEFHAQLEQPSYEPTNRILIKRGDQIVGHVRVEYGDMYFGGRRVAILVCRDLVTLPEYRHQGCEDILCEVVQQAMDDSEAVLGIVRTRTPQPFLRNGWCVCGRHTYSTAPVRDILSHLSATCQIGQADSPPDYQPLLPSSKRHRPLSIRLWRHVEQVALTRLYVENVATWYGPLVRGDEYWRWLVGRRGYERLYIAIEGPDKFELDDRLDSIVGYAVMKQGRLLEMMTSQRCPHAQAQLLARACGDAIEQDQTIIRVDAPGDDPLHPLIVAAGGTHRHHEVDNGEVFLANLRDPWGYLSSIRQDLIQRVRRAHAERPGELGLLVDGEKYRLIVGRRDVKLIPGKLGRSYLECSAAQFSQLLLGQHDPKEAVAAGRITASTSIASEWGSILFPKLPLWIPPWDDMPA